MGTKVGEEEMEAQIFLVGEKLLSSKSVGANVGEEELEAREFFLSEKNFYPGRGGSKCWGGGSRSTKIFVVGGKLLSSKNVGAKVGEQELEAQ